MTAKFLLPMLAAAALSLAPAGIDPAKAAGDCRQAAARVAAQTGGQVLSATPSEQGGRAVCVVSVLVPGKGGALPRKETVTVPQ